MKRMLLIIIFIICILTINVDAKELDLYFYANDGQSNTSKFYVTDGYGFISYNNIDFFAMYTEKDVIKNINSISSHKFTLKKSGTSQVKGREWYAKSVYDDKIYYFSESKTYTVEGIFKTIGIENDEFLSLDLYANWDNKKKTGGVDMPTNNSTSTTSKSSTKSTNKQATSIKLSTSKSSIKVGDTIKVKATFNPSGSIREDITWSSSNIKVATVTSNGVVEGINEGSVTISAKTKRGLKAKINIKISKVSSIIKNSTDTMHVLRSYHGNAILLQTKGLINNHYALIDAGTTGSCEDVYDDIVSVIGEKGKLDYIILSHTDSDHTNCLKTILSRIKTKSIIMKYYYANEYLSKPTDRFNKFKQYAKNSDTIIYAIKSSSDSIYNNSFKFVNPNNNNKNITLKDAKFINHDDWNKSYMRLKFGNYKLFLFNLVQRKEATSDNYNSIPVYGEIDGYKFYIGGDIENSSSTITNVGKVEAYSDLSSYNYSSDAKRPFGLGDYRLADFYAQYINKYFSKGRLDIYVASHHGATNGTTTFIADKFIGPKTIVVFTSSYQYLNGHYSYGSITSDNPNCGNYSDTERKHRCLNDKTVNRIIYSLSNKNPNSKSSATIYHTDMNKVLKFGFNTKFSSGVNKVAISANPTVYKYKTTIKR